MRTLLRKIEELEGAASENAMAVSAYCMAISVLPGKEKDLEKNIQDIKLFIGCLCKQCGLGTFTACFVVVRNEEPWLKSC